MKTLLVVARHATAPDVIVTSFKLDDAIVVMAGAIGGEGDVRVRRAPLMALGAGVKATLHALHSCYFRRRASQ
jgi:hypothetical protein